MKTKRIFVLFSVVLFSMLLTACAKNNMGGEFWADAGAAEDAFFDNLSQSFSDSYIEINEMPYQEVVTNPKTFFSLDSSKASYSNLRRYINNNMVVSKDAIKTDELINYFKYDLPKPSEEEFKITPNVTKCPWNEEHYLVGVGVASKSVEVKQNGSNNLVFLIDVSGSMTGSIELMKKSFPLMLDSLNPTDRISIVTYASGVKTVLSGCPVSEKTKITKALTSLKAGGSTNGAGGIELAYQIAKQYYVEGGNNRVLLATDGDFNVGISTIDELKAFISQKRETGVYLSVLGFSVANYYESTCETLAMNGNGNYFFIDSLIEAKKVLCEELATSIITVAKDVKVQVEFNPEIVKSYRVIGYENKTITEDDFKDEKKDALEVGSDHTTIAFFEVILKEGVQPTNELGCTVTLNYKTPEDISKTTSLAVYMNDIYDSEEFVFASCIVEFSLILRNSEYRGNANMNSLIAKLESLDCIQGDIYREEFLTLVKKARISNS